MSNIVPFKRPVRLADLVRQADRVSADRVLPIIVDSMRDFVSESPAAPLTVAHLRRLVLTAALINRLLFELARIPRDPEHLI